MADFFTQDDPKKMDDTKQTPVEPEAIEVAGEKYTQEELNRLVNLGKIGDEAEKVYKTKIDKVWPEYTKTTQELKAAREELAKEREAAKAAPKVETPELSQTELREQARRQAKELGLMTNEDFDQLYVQRRAAERLLEDVNNLVDDAQQKGQPKTTTEALLQHMQETGIKNPVKAYKDKYEDELKVWEQEQMKKVQPTGLYTTPATTAGSKSPKPINFVGMKQDDLGKLVSESLSGV